MALKAAIAKARELRALAVRERADADADAGAADAKDIEREKRLQREL